MIPESSFSVLSMFFHLCCVGFGSNVLLVLTSVGTPLDSTPIGEGDDYFSFD